LAELGFRQIHTFQGSAHHAQHHAKVRHSEVMLVLQIHKRPLICISTATE